MNQKPSDESAFLESVVRDLVEDARRAGEEDPAETLEEWCAEAAVQMFERIGGIAFALKVARDLKEHGRPTDERLEGLVLESVARDLADDPALLAAFEIHAWRIEDEGVADLLRRLCVDARDCEPRHPLRTRAGLWLRGRYPKLLEALGSVVEGRTFDNVARAAHAEYLSLESAGGDVDSERLAEGLRERFELADED